MSALLMRRADPTLTPPHSPSQRRLRGGRLTETKLAYENAKIKVELLEKDRKLEAELTKEVTELREKVKKASGTEELSGLRQEYDAAKKRLGAIRADIGHLLTRPDLPGWAQDSMKKAQRDLELAIR